MCPVWVQAASLGSKGQTSFNPSGPNAGPARCPARRSPASCRGINGRPAKSVLRISAAPVQPAENSLMHRRKARLSCSLGLACFATTDRKINLFQIAE